MKTETHKEQITAPEVSDTEIVENLVSEYYAKHQESPFKDFQMKDDEQMAVDMDSDFEATILAAFGDESSRVLGDYVGDLIRNLMENLSEEELTELKKLQAKEDCDSDECCKN